MLLCVFINLSGLSHTHFLIALCLLGVGWNFMYISATQMVSETYTVSERGKSQAANEFLVFSMVTFSTLLAGPLEASLGWQTVNLASTPLLMCGLALLWYYKKHQLAR